MRKIIAILLIFVWVESSYSQDFTDPELKNWTETDYPETIIHLLDAENFLYEQKRFFSDEKSAAKDEKKYYYSYIKGIEPIDWPYFNITCHITVDKNFPDNIPRDQQCIQFQFYSRIKKSYDYLLAKIRDYFSEDWVWISSNGTKFDVYSNEDEGVMQYVINIWYPLDK